MKKSKWYDMFLDKIKEYSKYMTNHNEFLDMNENSKKLMGISCIEVSI